MEKNRKKVFLGAEVASPWIDLPEKKRVVAPSMRHITLKFIGWTEKEPPIPLIPFVMSPVGILNDLLFLPKNHPRVIAYQAIFLSEESNFKKFQEELIDKQAPSRPALPHVTIARTSSLDRDKWEKWFTPLPFFIKGIHLYESKDELCYTPLFSQELIPPFIEIEHTADLAFLIQGCDFNQLYLHGALALAFSYPPMILSLEVRALHSLEEVIEALNHLITKIDIESGCPFKAVSFQGRVTYKEQYLYQWEMIVDV